MGYSASQAQGVVTTFPGVLPCQSLTQWGCLTFYWTTAPNSGQARPVTFTYALSNGLSASATATFNLYAPVITAPVITSQVGSAQAEMVNVPNPPGPPNPTPYMLLFGLAAPAGSGSSGAGIVFTTPAPPAPGNNGTYLWAQLITTDQAQRRTGNGTTTDVCIESNGSGGTLTLPVLDNHFPYGDTVTVTRPNDTAWDAPTFALLSTYVEVQRLFAATMYLMWDPTLPSGCAAASSAGPSTCTSIPIPVGSVAWNFPGNGINTLAPYATGNLTTWVVPCGPGAAGACVTVTPGTSPTASFPQWSSTFTNSNGLTCH
jgi:hypothetical protein